MNHDTDQLTETFAAHEHLAPDPEVVLAKAREIARSYQRRRWAVRATGGAVLGAGLVAGGIAIPAAVGHGSTETVTPGASGGGASPTPTGTPATYTQDEDWAAYFAAGYDYGDAVKLRSLWNESGTNIGTVKAEAGEKLLQGQKLPVDPSGTPETAAQQAQDAFFAAGYGYQDAVTLGNMWHESDITQVKTDAGQKLLDGKPLPIPPSGQGLADPSATPTSGGSKAGSSEVDSANDNDLYAFFAAGYTYDDAVAIAKAWNESDPYQVKAEAGKRLLDGKSLPVDPSGTPASKQDNEFHAFFAAGYTYDDAVRLGKMWHESNIDQVKADAGQKLLDGKPLPISP
jgi:hypothetical protein